MTQIKARFNSTCSVCGVAIRKGTLVEYDGAVRHIDCQPVISEDEQRLTDAYTAAFREWEQARNAQVTERGRLRAKRAAGEPITDTDRDALDALFARDNGLLGRQADLYREGAKRFGWK